MGFSRQEHCSGLPFPSPGDLPDLGIEPGLPHCRQTLYRLSPPNSHLGYYSHLCGLLLLSNLFPFVSLQTSLIDFPLKVFKCSLKLLTPWLAGFTKFGCPPESTLFLLEACLHQLGEVLQIPPPPPQRPCHWMPYLKQDALKSLLVSR